MQANLLPQQPTRSLIRKPESTGCRHSCWARWVPGGRFLRSLTSTTDYRRASIMFMFFSFFISLPTLINMFRQCRPRLSPAPVSTISYGWLLRLSAVVEGKCVLTRCVEARVTCSSSVADKSPASRLSPRELAQGRQCSTHRQKFCEQTAFPPDPKNLSLMSAKKREEGKRRGNSGRGRGYLTSSVSARGRWPLS